mgnify:FL=1
MLGFIKRLEALMREEREKMIGKAVLYAENMEAGNRNGYMTHKYAASVIKGIAEDYKQEISKILEQQEKTKQDKLVSDKVEKITLMKEQHTKERNEAKKKAVDTPVIPINNSIEENKSKVVLKNKTTPKKVVRKKATPKKVDKDSSDKGE